MSKSSRATIVKLAKAAEIEIDEALIILWDAGFKEINGPDDVLTGSRLLRAKKTLFIPTTRNFISPGFWQYHLSLNELELRQLLLQLRIPMSSNARRLPKGAIKKLRIEAQNRIIRKSIPLPTPLPQPVPIEQKECEPGYYWKTIGHEKQVRLLKLEEVIAIHNALVADFLVQDDPIVPSGPRNEDIIASAVYRQHTALGNQLKYLSIEMCAAALLHSIVHDHPFHNGNKRTALVCMLVLLDENGITLTCPENELFKFVLLVAQHIIVNLRYRDLSDREVITIAEWILRNSRQVERGNRPLPFRKLRIILSSYDCHFEYGTRGSSIKITRTIKAHGLFSKNKQLTSTLHCTRESSEVPKAIINNVRSDLELNDEHGIDSAAFYDKSPISADEFIVKYRKTLLRLAKL
jgi:death-on-curing family protein